MKKLDDNKTYKALGLPDKYERRSILFILGIIIITPILLWGIWLGLMDIL